MNKLSAILVGLLAIVSAQAQQELDKVIDKSAQITKSAAASQNKINKISEQIEDKLQQYKMVNKEIEGLKVYNAQLEKQLSKQLIEIQQLNDSIDKVSVIERQVTPLMLRMINGIEELVRLDVPFLKQERTKRVNDLKDMMDESNVAVSEKFRRVLEAYQIEMLYGRTIEAYTSILSINNVDTDVDFLRIGRVALIYQTRDKKSMGIWNASAKQWESLDNSYRSQVARGLKMARKQMAPDLLTVPIFSAK